MPDNFDKLFEALSSQLPNKRDKDVLKSLLDALKEGGREAVVDKIDRIVNDIVGEDS